MSKKEDSPTAGLPVISTAKMQTTYANFCRGLMTAEEIMLDFGFNPNSSGKTVDEQAEVTSRVIMSVPSTVRLYQLLHALLAKRQEAVQAAQAAAGQPSDGGSEAGQPESQA